jgi:hypothetical protein
VEELLIPIVIPNKLKANLGGVAGEFKANPRSGRLTCQQSEAEAVVHMAIAIIELCRGRLTKLP